MPKTSGQLAYERDCLITPNYRNGLARDPWESLPEIAQWSWERSPTTFDEEFAAQRHECPPDIRMVRLLGRPILGSEQARSVCVPDPHVWIQDQLQKGSAQLRPRRARLLSLREPQGNGWNALASLDALRA